MGFTKKTIDKIKAMYESGYSCAEIANALELNESTIRAIVKP